MLRLCVALALFLALASTVIAAAFRPAGGLLPVRWELAEQNRVVNEATKARPKLETRSGPRKKNLHWGTGESWKGLFGGAGTSAAGTSGAGTSGAGGKSPKAPKTRKNNIGRTKGLQPNNSNASRENRLGKAAREEAREAATNLLAFTGNEHRAPSPKKSSKGKYASLHGNMNRVRKMLEAASPDVLHKIRDSTLIPNSVTAPLLTFEKEPVPVPQATALPARPLATASQSSTRSQPSQQSGSVLFKSYDFRRRSGS